MRTDRGPHTKQKPASGIRLGLFFCDIATWWMGSDNIRRKCRRLGKLAGEMEGGGGGKSRGEGGWSIWAAVSFVRLCQRRRFWRTAFHNPAPTIIIWWRRLFKWRAFNLQMSLDPSLWTSLRKTDSWPHGTYEAMPSRIRVDSLLLINSATE